MFEKSIKKYKLIAWIAVAIAAVCIVAFLVMFSAAEWHLLRIHPFWLGCVFVLLAGLSMATACGMGYFILLKREEEKNTVVCPSCGSASSSENAFCPHCGAKIE